MLQKRAIGLLLVSGGLLVLSACAPLLVVSGAAGGYYVGQDDRNVKTIANDASITAAVKAKLIADRYIKAFSVDVDTRRGVVTLQGVADTLAIEDKIILLTSEVNGVKKIVSRMEIASSR